MLALLNTLPSKIDLVMVERDKLAPEKFAQMNFALVADAVLRLAPAKSGLVRWVSWNNTPLDKSAPTQSVASPRALTEVGADQGRPGEVCCVERCRQKRSVIEISPCERTCGQVGALKDTAL